MAKLGTHYWMPQLPYCDRATVVIHSDYHLG